MTPAARAWLESLTREQRERAVWPFGSSERGNWHYAPRQRNGLPLREMTDPQRVAALDILRDALSQQGFAKAQAIMALEAVLADIEGDRRRRDPLNYSFTLFGDPDRLPWGWRVEGHHLIVNVTVAGPDAGAVTPTFWGANPARIPRGPRAGERVLDAEYHLGLELAGTLTPSQRREAVLSSTSVGNILTERGRARALELERPEGLSCSGLDAQQRRVLAALLSAYVGNMPDAFAAPYLDLVLGHAESLRFAWAGGMAEGEAFYYRVHGPRVLVEFDCTQDDANHIHTVWRDPVNDWGRDVLGEHYRHQHDDD